MIQTGGIVAFRVQEAIHIKEGGQLHVNGKGFTGASGSRGEEALGRQGESYRMNGEGFESNEANGAGGGGGRGNWNSGSYVSGGGGGGSYGTHGQDGSHPSDYSAVGRSGTLYGIADLSTIYLGSGGGSGGATDEKIFSGHGGNGGGIIMIYAPKIVVEGYLQANGDSGEDLTDSQAGNGGGGSGGSIRLSADDLHLTDNHVTATGGDGGNSPLGGDGGDGGAGRIHINLVGTNE